ncbi:MAG TPA: riboflavin synthase [Solirubrobacteraceae bacterium]|nr:riboflavin synthase [Solirubrobacteraceae bacterium]
MFTGLIADLGSVTELQRDADADADADGADAGIGTGTGATLTISTRLTADLQEGDSIAVNGVCLTATSVDAHSFRAQAMAETLRRSSLGALAVGAPVNLELALRADDRLGGHIVQGHVDGTGVITELRDEGFARVLTLDIDPALTRYLVLKGSVTIDGVSLTVSALHERGFAVSLIPETLARTTLGQATLGQQVNLEVDILAKHVERLMETSA